MLAVVLAVRGAREAVIAGHLDRHPDLTVSRRCADLAEAVAVLQAGHGAVVVVSDQPYLDRDVLAHLAASGAVVVGAPSSADSADHLRALGIEDLLPVDADAVETAAAVIRAADKGAPLPPVPTVRPDVGVRGPLIAVWGPNGAPGRTTVAVNLAADLAAFGWDTTCADADTYGGAVAHAYGLLDEAPGLAALARASAQGALTDDVLNRYAVEVQPRLRVFGGISRAERWPELSAPALEPVWDRLRACSDAVVVDCGFSIEQDEVLAYDTRAPQRNAATLSALAAAQMVVVVGRAEPLGVQRLVHALADLEESGHAAQAQRIVVVNRVRSSVAGARPEQSLADALRRFASVPSIWPIPEDARTCDAASLAGRTLRECRPRSAAARAIAGLAHEIRVQAQSRTEGLAPLAAPSHAPAAAPVTD